MRRTFVVVEKHWHWKIMVLMSLWSGICLCLFGWWLIKKLRLRLFYDLHKMPSPPGEIPILGHALSMNLGSKPKYHKYLMDKTLELGKIWRFNILGEDTIVITNREASTLSLYGPGEKAEPKPRMYQYFQRLGGEHKVKSLFTCETAHEQYKSFRKTMAVAFSSENLKKNFPRFLQEAHKVADIVGESAEEMKSIDFQHLGIRYAFDNIGIFAYDFEFDSLKTGHPLLSALTYCTDECMMDAIIPGHKLTKILLPFLDKAKKDRSGFQALYAEYQKLFDRADLFGDAPGDEDKSIRACLMRLRNPLRNNEKANRDELMAEFTGFTVGGIDTTGHQIGWMMMRIADESEVQDKIYSELEAEGLVGAGARELEYTDLQKLTYLKMVITEVLRTTSVATAHMARGLSKDTTIMGYRIPKGTSVGIAIRTQNNAPWLWKDPDVFRPERWAKENSVEREGESGEGRGSKELWTFGYGVRDCVGQRLAMVELQLFLVMMVSKFTFELDPRMGGMDGAISMGFNSLVTVCEGGAWVKASRRPHDLTSI